MISEILARRCPLVIWLLAIGFCASAHGQSKNDIDTSDVKRTWRVGATIQGAMRPVRQVLVTFPIPTDWPEQHVNVYEENIPPEFGKADYRDVDGLRQMVALIPILKAREEVEINVILDVTVSAVPYPDRTDHLVIPPQPPRDIRFHKSPSPLIESRQSIIKKQAKELVKGIDSPWEQVRAFYDFVTTEITIEGKEVIGAKKTLKDKKGSAEDLSNLFIAMCRCHKVPARMVWADGAEYTEFYLQDDDGKGRWYPVVLEGRSEFGQMTNPRVIIQKGDKFKVPEKSQRQRFVVEHVRGSGEQGIRPRVRFLRDVLPARDRSSN